MSIVNAIRFDLNVHHRSPSKYYRLGDRPHLCGNL